jgi:hypothetical protein
MIKRILPLALAGMTLVSGCGDEFRARHKDNFYKTKNYKGFVGDASIVATRRVINLYDKDSEGKIVARLHAADFPRDGRLDEIDRSGVPKGHPLNDLATFDELDRAYNDIKENGESK